MIRRQRDGDLGFQRYNTSGRVRAHLFARNHLHSLERNRMSFGHNAHDGGHACGQSGRHQIGRGKALPLSFIINGRIRLELAAGGPMNRRAVKLPLVTDVDFDQGDFRSALPAARRTSPRRSSSQEEHDP